MADRCRHCGLIVEASGTEACPSPMNLTKVCEPYPQLIDVAPSRLLHEIEELRTEVLELQAINAQLADERDQWRSRFVDLSHKLSALALQFADARNGGNGARVE